MTFRIVREALIECLEMGNALHLRYSSVCIS